MRLIALGLILLTFAACAPTAERYCAEYVDRDDDAFGQCVGHYNAQQTAFDADRDLCETLAILTYPPNLQARKVQPPAIGLSNVNGRVTPQENERAPQFEWPTSQYERERAHAVRLCMGKLGWNSPDAWQAGRHPYPVCAKCHKKIRKPKITVVNTKKPHDKTL